MFRTALISLSTLVVTLPALAQERTQREPFRTRIILGGQLKPASPGADGVVARPYFDVSRARGNRPFTFEAPDESTGTSLYEDTRFAIGPALSFQGKRKSDKVGGLDEVGFTFEAGAFVHYKASPSVRLSVEARQGIGGHKGLIGMIGADYIARDGDRWLFSIGPRLTASNGRHARSYFGVTPREAAGTGIPAFRPDGGAISVGGTASVLRQLNRRWTLFGYTKYDRMIGDAADSPVVDRFGSRNQFSGGVGLGYSFGRGL